jgi:hypothetical protein
MPYIEIDLPSCSTPCDESSRCRLVNGVSERYRIALSEGDVTDTVPVPRLLVRRLWIVLAIGLLSLALTTIQGIVRPGYDAWHQAVSALSLGPGGWVQMVNLIGFGTAVLTTVPTWRRILAGRKGGSVYPLLTAMLGVSFIVVGAIPQDPAPGYDPAGLALQAPTPWGLAHLTVAGVAALSSVAGLFVMAARFAGDPAWRGWTLYSVAAGIAVIGCVTLFGVWSTRPTGFAGTFERGAIIVPMVWMYALLRRLALGAPFMKSRTLAGNDYVATTSTSGVPAGSDPFQR